LKSEYIYLTGATISRRGNLFDVIYEDRIVATERMWEVALVLALNQKQLNSLLRKNNNIHPFLKIA
jgi:hypothetical protein